MLIYEPHPIAVMKFFVIVSVVLVTYFQFIQAAKPNIVYILTDDQDIRLNSLHVQPKVKSLLIEQGLYFENAYATTPVCCPSRSSILTGKYVHNHGTYENTVPTGCDSQSWRDRNEHKTMGAYMSNAGYKTGFFGKYLNYYALPESGETVAHIPPGWTRWYAQVGNSKYFDYSVSNQGKEEKHGKNYTQDYFTDRIRDEAVQFIKDSTKDNDKTPFFMYIATPAPHRPATPAPQYADKFANEVAPRTPSYGLVGTDKHWIISKGTPPLTNNVADVIDNLYRDRIRTLLSVDDLVEEVVTTLEKMGVLDNTYIFYNSDHGYHLGEFGQHGEKRQPYDENIWVPLIVRGPNVPKNKNTSALALNIDMVPTFIDLAGSVIADDIDGVSLKPVLMAEDNMKNEDDYQFLLEYYGEGGQFSHCKEEFGFIHDCHNNTWIALRGVSSETDYIFAQFYKKDDFPVDPNLIYFQEFYNITKDPWEIKNDVNLLSFKEKAIFEIYRGDMIPTCPKDHPYDCFPWAYLDRWYKCSGKTCQDMRKINLKN